MLRFEAIPELGCMVDGVDSRLRNDRALKLVHDKDVAMQSSPVCSVFTLYPNHVLTQGQNLVRRLGWKRR